MDVICEVLPPEKAFLSQHEDITSCQGTNMVLQESVTLLHINYISVSYDQDAINVGLRNNVADGNPLSKRKLHGIWYLTENNFNLSVGNNCMRKKVCVLIAQAGRVTSVNLYNCSKHGYIPVSQHWLCLLPI